MTPRGKFTSPVGDNLIVRPDDLLDRFRIGDGDQGRADSGLVAPEERPLRRRQAARTAPFGIIGLETSVGLALTELVHKGVIGLERLVELCSANPAKILGLAGRGTLKAGSVADITIIDPELEWTYSNAESRSKSRNSPFDGRHFRGGVSATIVGGRIVYKK